MKLLNPKLLLRIAAGCLLFFAVGHSFGHATRHSVDDPEEQKFLRLLADTKFNMFGTMRSFDENYEGMSLNLVFTLLMMVVLVWIMSAHLTLHSALIKKLIIPLTLCVVVFCITSFRYFFPVPGFSCMLAAIFLVLAFWRLGTGTREL